MNFISQTNKEIHTEHLRTLKLRMSIFEKSYPEITGKSCKEILKLSIRRSEREQAAALKADIMAHDLYFNSFSECNSTAESVRSAYGSEAAFLYQLSRAALDGDGFLFVFADKKGVPIWKVCREPLELFSQGIAPFLALDLCEHAYFYDYLFNKAEYVKAATLHLDLSGIK